MKPLIRVKSTILNIANIQRIEVDGPDLLNVYMMPDVRLIQFEEEDAHALLAALSDYVNRSLTATEKAAEGDAQSRPSFEKIARELIERKPPEEKESK